ncbi:MAG: hypothetical protein PHG31_02715 [Candidatus Omnitrophica bacterium]|nr:hypothetical protein [Candidatus Omnitrophota bacterium]
MVKIVNQEDRRNKVMAFTVNAYIAGGQPVSSQVLAEHFGLSSATMRNILAELEEEGYFYHPHTSAGRVPTRKGYRYYVDFLMSQQELSEDIKLVILEGLTGSKRAHFDLEELLEKTSDIVAELTHYTSLVWLSSLKGRIFFKGLRNMARQPEFRDAQKLSLLLELLEERTRLLALLNQEFQDHCKVYIGEEIGCSVGEDCSLVVSAYHKGRRDSGRLAVLGPLRMSYEQTVATLAFVSFTLNKLLEETDY